MSKCVNFSHVCSAYIRISYIHPVSHQKLEQQGLSPFKIVSWVHDKAGCLVQAARRLYITSHVVEQSAAVFQDVAKPCRLNVSFHGQF